MSTLLFWFIIIGVALLIPTAYAGKIGAPWAPTRKRAITRAFKELGIDSSDLVVDLGAGDAKVLLEASRRGARAVGYELSPIMWFVACIRTFYIKGIQVKFKNFFRATLPSDTTVIFVFLMPENMPRLQAYIKSQKLPHLKHIASYAFQFKEIDPVATFRETDCAPVFIYRSEDIKR